jgi:hypothetical protein
MRSSHTFPLAANLAAVHLAVADLDIELVVLLIWTPPNALFFFFALREHAERCLSRQWDDRLTPSRGVRCQ